MPSNRRRRRRRRRGRIKFLSKRWHETHKVPMGSEPVKLTLFFDAFKEEKKKEEKEGEDNNTLPNIFFSKNQYLV